MSDDQRKMRLEYLDFQFAMGKTPDGNHALFILVRPEGSDEEHRAAVVMRCSHVAGRLVETLREAKAFVWPRGCEHEPAIETDELHEEEVTPGVRAVFRGGHALAEAPPGVPDAAVVKAVERALARHERAARQLWLWLDAAKREGVGRGQSGG